MTAADILPALYSYLFSIGLTILSDTSRLCSRSTLRYTIRWIFSSFNQTRNGNQVRRLGANKLTFVFSQMSQNKGMWNKSSTSMCDCDVMYCFSILLPVLKGDSDSFISWWRGDELWEVTQRPLTVSEQGFCQTFPAFVMSAGVSKSHQTCWR